ncbi:MAG: CHASE2 domain-containing protein, partial [Rhodocyclaceae bacterium]
APATDCGRADLPALALTASFDGSPADVCAAQQRVTLVAAGKERTAPQLLHLPFSELQRMRSTPTGCPAMQRDDLVATNLMVLSPQDYWRNPPQRYSYAGLHSPPTGSSLPDLRGRFVLIGVTTQAARDIHVVQRGFAREERFGVELQADALRNLLSGFTLRPVPMGVQSMLIVALALLGAFTRFAVSRWRRAPRIGIVLALICAYLAFSVVLSSIGILLKPMYDIVAFGLAYRILGWLETRADAAMVTGPSP